MQELSLHLLDIAQNAIAANATKIHITVEVREEEDVLLLTVEDNGSGMEPAQAKKAADPFFTGRTTRKVGLGLSLLEMAARQSGGSLSIASQKGEGTRVQASFGLSHIDRMPMGDLAGTVCALIQCNPLLDFVFTCRGGKGEFMLSTAELRGIFEEIPLSHPQVILHIGDYIRQHTAQILTD